MISCGKLTPLSHVICLWLSVSLQFQSSISQYHILVYSHCFGYREINLAFLLTFINSILDLIDVFFFSRNIAWWAQEFFSVFFILSEAHGQSAYNSCSTQFSSHSRDDYWRKQCRFYSWNAANSINGKFIPPRIIFIILRPNNKPTTHGSYNHS